MQDTPSLSPRGLRKIVQKLCASPIFCAKNCAKVVRAQFSHNFGERWLRGPEGASAQVSHIFLASQAVRAINVSTLGRERKSTQKNKDIVARKKRKSNKKQGLEGWRVRALFVAERRPKSKTNDLVLSGRPRFGSVTVRGWNGSSGSGFRFRRFLCKKGFSLFQYSLAGKDGIEWKTGRSENGKKLAEK